MARNLPPLLALLLAAVAILGFVPGCGKEDPPPASRAPSIVEGITPGEAPTRDRLVERGLWRLDGFGIALPLLEGWTQDKTANARFVLGDSEEEFATHVEVYALPNAGGLTIDDFEVSMRAAEKPSLGSEMISLEKVELAGRTVLRSESRPTTNDPNGWRSSTVSATVGEKLVIVKAIATVERWDEHSSQLEAIIDGIRFLDDD